MTDSPTNRPSSSLLAARLVGVLALGLPVVVVGLGLLGSRSGLWPWPIGPRPVPIAVGGSGSVAGSDRIEDGAISEMDGEGSASSPGAPVDRRSEGDADAVAGTGRLAGDRGGLGTEARGDAVLFAALERFDRLMAEIIARARESVVALEYTGADVTDGKRRVATGVVINNRGEVVSIRIDPPPARPAPGTGRILAPIVARDCSGRRHVAQWVAEDPETGLTLLRVAPRAVRPIRMAPGEPELGSQVFVVGTPFGMGHSVSRGHVAGLNRALELGPRQLGGLIQIQAPLYPGDSGAAVVNIRGEWLGSIRSGLAIPGSGSGSESGPATPSADSVSSPPSSPSSPPTVADAEAASGRDERENDFGFAIPARDAKWVAGQLRTSGRVDRAYLGVKLETSATGEIAPSSPDSKGSGSVAGAGADWRTETASGSTTNAPAEPSGVSGVVEEGARLREVLTGTPAARAGLQAGDRIVALDGHPIRSAHDLTDRLDRIPARTTVRLEVDRDLGTTRQRIPLSLVTASRPASGVAGLGSPPLPATSPATGSGSVNASVPVTPTASRTPKEAAPGEATTTATTTTPAQPSTPAPASEPLPRPVKPLPSSADPNPPLTDRAEPVAPPPATAPQLNELRLNLPRAFVERLEHLERRLEHLEHVRANARESKAGPEPFPARPAGPEPAPDRQPGSSRKP